MPTYEYVCSNCQNQWEEVQRISEPAVQTCPKCSQATAKRQISAGNFILKGGGWYADLYSSSKPAKKDDAGASEGKAETKAKDGADGEAKGKDGSAAPAKAEKSEAPASPPKPASPASAGAGGEGKS
jgi:putative FmdB family regulatory protein